MAKKPLAFIYLVSLHAFGKRIAADVVDLSQMGVSLIQQSCIAKLLKEHFYAFPITL